MIVDDTAAIKSRSLMTHDHRRVDAMHNARHKSGPHEEFASAIQMRIEADQIAQNCPQQPKVTCAVWRTSVTQDWRYLKAIYIHCACHQSHAKPTDEACTTQAAE